MDSDFVLVLLIIFMMMTGLSVLLMAMHGRRRLRELQHQERIAMINRGLMPAPERDPARFDREMGTLPRQSTRVERTRSAGVVLIGFGIGLAILLSLAAGQPGIGVGLGGAFAALGGALVVNAMLSAHAEPYYPPEVPPAPRLDHPDPPSSLS